MEIADRKPRIVNGPNFKWDEEATKISFFLAKVNLGADWIINVADKIGIKSNVLSNKVSKLRYYDINIPGKSDFSKLEISVFEKYNNLSSLDMLGEIENFLKSEYAPIEKKAINHAYEEVPFDELKHRNEIERAYEIHWRIEKLLQISNLNELDWDFFVKAISMMNIKSRGMKIEKRVLARNNLKKSVMSEEGDAWLETGEGLEIKTSFITPLLGSGVSLAGFRLWESKVKYYLCIIVDLRNPNEQPITYKIWLPKEKLEEFDLQGKLSTPSMKKSIAVSNKNVARGLTLKTDELIELQAQFPLPKGFVL